MERSNDEQIREAVQNRLLDNPRTTDTAIEVAVLNQQVSLRGVVRSPEAREAAEAEARAVNGVINVSNELEVHQDEGDEYTDTRTDAGEVPTPFVPKTNE